MSNITTFRANMGPKGLAKINRFEVTVDGSPSEFMASTLEIRRNLIFKCGDAELAGRSLSAAEIRYYGPIMRLPYHTTFPDVTLNFYTQDDMSELKFFHDWMTFIAGDGTYDMRFPNEYRTTMTVAKLDEQNNTVLTLRLNKAYPVNINPVPLSWGDEGFVRTIIQFSFQEALIEQ